MFSFCQAISSLHMCVLYVGPSMRAQTRTHIHTYTIHVLISSLPINYCLTLSFFYTSLSLSLYLSISLSPSLRPSFSPLSPSLHPSLPPSPLTLSPSLSPTLSLFHYLNAVNAGNLVCSPILLHTCKILCHLHCRERGTYML